MTDQHRATPEQWDLIAETGSGCMSATILELRARVEALEATQHAHADLSRLSDAEREAMAQEMAKPAAWRPLKVETTYDEATATAQQILNPRMVVEGTFEHGGETYRFKAKPELESAMAELRAASAEARPAGGLVERVAMALDSSCPQDEYVINDCRAAIREVAAWLRENDSECQMGGDAAATAELLEREANRG